MWIKLSAWCLNLKDRAPLFVLVFHLSELELVVSNVSNFKYLGHIIMDNLSDDGDIRREIRCTVYVHTM